MTAPSATAGKRRREITIQRRTGAKDGWGTAQPAGWEDVCKPWANILKANGAEATKADAIRSTVRASFRITWRTGITPGMRVLHGTEVYDIKVVLPDEVGRQHVDLACELVT